MDEITFTPASTKDGKQIYEMISALEEKKLNLKEFNEVFENNITNPNVYYLVARQGEQIVGFASLHIQKLLHHTGNAAELQEVYVSPLCRSQGIGAKLLKRLVSIAKRNKCKVFEVTCNMRRKDTHRFYEREDMKPTHYKFVKAL